MKVIFSLLFGICLIVTFTSLILFYKETKLVTKNEKTIRDCTSYYISKGVPKEHIIIDYKNVRCYVDSTYTKK